MRQFMTLAGWIFAPEIIALFRKEDAVVIAIGTRAMRFQCSVLLLQPLFVTTNMMLQAAGFAWRATFLACTRQGITLFRSSRCCRGSSASRALR